MFSYEFARPAVTVDVIALQVAHDRLSVLLVERGDEPFKGLLALPGGFVRMEEELEDAAARVLQAKAAAEGVYLEQLATFGAIDRDPRERTISVSYLAVLPADHEYAGPGTWQAVESVTDLAFDHVAILRSALQRVRSKLGYSSLGLMFLPQVFTLTDAQKAQEVILGKTLDKRNFRKSILARELLRDTGKKTQGGAHPPAALYERKNSTLVYW